MIIEKLQKQRLILSQHTNSLHKLLVHLNLTCLLLPCLFFSARFLNIGKPTIPYINSEVNPPPTSVNVVCKYLRQFSSKYLRQVSVLLCFQQLQHWIGRNIYVKYCRGTFYLILWVGLPRLQLYGSRPASLLDWLKMVKVDWIDFIWSEIFSQMKFVMRCALW